MADNTMKAILDVLAHAVELAQKEIENESNPETTSPVSHPDKLKTPAETQTRPVSQSSQSSQCSLVRFNTIEYTTLSHPEYGSVQVAVMNDEVFYKGLDVGSMFGYSGKNFLCHLTQDVRIILKAPSVHFPNGQQTSFLALEGVRELFCSRRLNRIPICKKMFNWLAKEIPAELAASQNKSA